MLPPGVKARRNAASFCEDATSTSSRSTPFRNGTDSKLSRPPKDADHVLFDQGFNSARLSPTQPVMSEVANWAQ
jgi:hypothetical protein